MTVESRPVKIITRHAARRLLGDNPRRLGARPLDKCKYEWKGSQKAYVGRSTMAPPNVLAIYIERREDRHGPFAQAMAVEDRA